VSHYTDKKTDHYFYVTDLSECNSPFPFNKLTCNSVQPRNCLQTFLPSALIRKHTLTDPQSHFILQPAQSRTVLYTSEIREAQVTPLTPQRSNLLQQQLIHRFIHPLLHSSIHSYIHPPPPQGAIAPVSSCRLPPPLTAVAAD
jgi:hypothetical protein